HGVTLDPRLQVNAQPPTVIGAEVFITGIVLRLAVRLFGSDIYRLANSVSDHNSLNPFVMCNAAKIPLELRLRANRTAVHRNNDVALGQTPAAPTAARIDRSDHEVITPHAEINAIEIHGESAAVESAPRECFGRNVHGAPLAVAIHDNRQPIAAGRANHALQ